MPPTPDDVEAAAGRLRRLAAGEGAGTVYAGLEHLGGITFFYTRDNRTLADAWLVEHPADDSLPIDAVWLASIGWQADPQPNDPARPEFRRWNSFLIVAARLGIWSAYCCGADGLDGREWPLCDLPDRGQLRRLLAALGVPPLTNGGAS